MATNFPVSLQDLDATRGTATQSLNSPSHVAHHLVEDDTIEAIQTKLGIDSSAVTTSLDYLLKNASSANPGHTHTAAQGATDKTFPAGTIVGTTDTQTLTNKTLTAPVIATIVNTGTLTLPTSTDTLVGKATTDTLTNKRITQRVGTVADAATITPTGDDSDMYTVTALAQAATIAAPSGTPTSGQKLILRFKDNGTGRALTWNAIYRAIGVTLPTTTVASKTHYVGLIYNTADTKWDAVAVQAEA